MIMPENLNKKFKLKSYSEYVTHENYYSAFPTLPSPLYPGPEPPPPPPPLPPPHPNNNNNKSDLDSLSKFTY